MFDVQCWMLDVGCSPLLPPLRLRASAREPLLFFALFRAFRGSKSFSSSFPKLRLLSSVTPLLRALSRFQILLILKSGRDAHAP